MTMESLAIDRRLDEIHPSARVMEGDRRSHRRAVGADEDAGLGHAGDTDTDDPGLHGPGAVLGELSQDAADNLHQLVGIHLGLGTRTNPRSRFRRLRDDPARQIHSQRLDARGSCVDSHHQVLRHDSSCLPRELTLSRG